MKRKRLDSQFDLMAGDRFSYFNSDKPHWEATEETAPGTFTLRSLLTGESFKDQRLPLGSGMVMLWAWR